MDDVDAILARINAKRTVRASMVLDRSGAILRTSLEPDQSQQVAKAVRRFIASADALVQQVEKEEDDGLRMIRLRTDKHDLIVVPGMLPMPPMLIRPPIHAGCAARDGLGDVRPVRQPASNTAHISHNDVMIFGSHAAQLGKRHSCNCVSAATSQVVIPRSHEPDEEVDGRTWRLVLVTKNASLTL